MTRISKRIFSWILGALAFVAIAFGILFALPQNKTAKADTAVTFSSANLENGTVEGSGEGYDYAVRFNTSELTWTVSQSYVAAEDWTSVSDYTTINGRTVTEINNANPNAKPILLKLQGAAPSFSFLRMYIDSDMIAIDDIRSLGILDGWSYQGNASAENYTSTAVTFLRDGSSMVLADSYSATKVTASEITIGAASDVNPSNANGRLDSYLVNIDIGMEITSTYNTMYSGYKTIRNSIYINGKSIEEWNAQAIAEDSRFADPSTYTKFPQNSTEASHADVFVKPVALWATSTGFQLSILKELVADCDKVVVTVGQGCTYSSTFMVSESKSETVLTQTVVELAEGMIFSDQGNQNNGTEQYTIYMGDSYWTKAPAGNTLNEYDVQDNDGVGGQYQLKYIYVNDRSIYDINADSDETFGSTQSNIANPNTGIYAPIMTFMGVDGGNSRSYIQLHIPTEYPTAGNTADQNHTSITFKKGFNVTENGVSYYLANDVVFTNTNGTWTKSITPETEDTEVSVTKQYHPGGFLTFALSNNDYPKAQSMVVLDATQKEIVAGSNLLDNIIINGVSLRDGGVGENILCLGGTGDSQGSLSLRIITIQNSTYTSNDVTDWAAWAAGVENPTVVIKKGAQFPTYDYLVNGGTISYYVTTEDVTYVYDATSGDFVVAGADLPTEEDFTKGVFTVSNDDTGDITPCSEYSYVKASSVSGMPAGTSDVVLKMTVNNGYAFVKVDFSASLILAANVESVVVKIWTPTANTASSQFRTGSTTTGTWTNGYSVYSTTADMTNSWYDVALIDQAITDMTDENGYLSSTILGVRAKSGETEFYIDSITVNMKQAEAVDITDGWTFSAYHNEAIKTEMYTLYAGGSYWTKTPLGDACLNEYDPEGAGGGQEQMKYIYFNDVSLYDINKNDHGAYGSTQSNIAGGVNNGVYAPVLVMMGQDSNYANKSYIQLYIPTGFDGTKADDGASNEKTANVNHKSITLKADFSVTEGETTWTLKEDITWYNHSGTWNTTPPVEETTYDTEVTGIITQANPAEGNQENFVIIQISNNDYADCNTTAVASTPNKDLSGLYGKIEIVKGDGTTETVNSISGQMFFNVWSKANSVAFRWSEYSALQQVKSITIKAGAKFPAATAENTYYVTSEDVTFIHDAPNDVWTNEADIIDADSITIANATKSGDVYKVSITIPGITFDTTDSNGANPDSFYFNYFNSERNSVRQHLYINGLSLYDINTTVGDSGYNYTTYPMTHRDANGNIYQQQYGSDWYDVFVNPTLLYTENNTNVLTVWIFEGYVEDIIEDGIKLTLGDGFTYGGKIVDGDYSYQLTAAVTATVDDSSKEYIVMKGETLTDVIPTPTKAPEETVIYTFKNWCIAGTDEECTSVTEDTVEIEAKFEKTGVTQVIETEIVGLKYYTRGYNADTGVYFNDNWLVFYLSETDYPTEETDSQLVPLFETDDAKEKEYLTNIGFLENVTVYGTIKMNDGSTVTQTTLLEYWNSLGTMNGPFINIWNHFNSFGIRVGNVTDYDNPETVIEKVVISANTSFPSYRYTQDSTKDYRYVIGRTLQFDLVDSDSDSSYYENHEENALRPRMADGAGVRITSTAETSGIRFQTIIPKTIVAELEEKVALGWYDSVSYGTIIVPTEYLMGGQFTHEWLTANYGGPGAGFIDIPSSGWYQFDPDADDVTYYGSIVKLYETNYNRKFSGLGYIKLTYNGEDHYIYADYSVANSRTAAFVADAAFNDRSTTQSSDYYYEVEENGNFSPYNGDQRKVLSDYIKEKMESVDNGTVALTGSGMLSDTLNADGRRDITFKDEHYVTIGANLSGAYVTINYKTNTDVWGQFVYRQASDESAALVYEEFYLQAGSSQHKQYLDIFRKNGVGYGLSGSDLYLVKIGFADAVGTTDSQAQNVKLISYTSKVGSIDYSEDGNLEQYVTKTIKDDGYGNSFEMTIGAHLGLGGAFTYLAKSGIYEGVTETGYRSGEVRLHTNTDNFVETRYTNFMATKEEAGSYGSETSSKSTDNAVNLINNFDAGRQIQQSWYANVGGSDAAATGANGYLRGYCYTEGENGKYWPYNPVQAGDVVSNPSQIIDYEVNEEKGYIYVKCRAMDWGKGYNSAKANTTNTVEGGVTTRSYMENYYRLNEDGTVTVNNSFVDWNGFTGMDSIGWQSIELPAVYPVHTLHTYLSNTDDDATDLEAYPNLGSWSEAGLAQTASGVAIDGSNLGYIDTSLEEDRLYAKKVTDWFIWANGDETTATVALGVYIPNVAQFVSGRGNDSAGTTALSLEVNRNAISNNVLWNDKNYLWSNMQTNDLTYKSTYVSNTSYTAPGINNKMKEYVPIEYTYVVSVNTVSTIKKQFGELESSGKINNSGLDVWARSDKSYTW